MTLRIRALLGLACLAAGTACADQPGPIAPASAVSARVGDWVNPGPPNLASRLSSLADLARVQAGRLAAVADGLVPPPDPDREMIAALADLRAAAVSLAQRSSELERIMGASLPPGPIHPPDPGFPPDPCQAVGRLLPPGPCRVGIFGSIGNALEGADSRLAGIQADFLPPPDADRPAVLTALADIKAAAMRLSELAGGLLSAVGE